MLVGDSESAATALQLTPHKRWGPSHCVHVLHVVARRTNNVKHSELEYTVVYKQGLSGLPCDRQDHKVPLTDPVTAV